MRGAAPLVLPPKFRENLRCTLYEAPSTIASAVPITTWDNSCRHHGGKLRLVVRGLNLRLDLRRRITRQANALISLSLTQ